MATDLILPPDEDIKPDFSAEEAGGFLKELFGLDCLKIAELNGYDDKNYKVDVSGGNQVGYVLKIMNSLDSGNLALVEGCNALLQFLEKSNIKCPKLVPTKNGDYYAIKTRNKKQHVIRLLEFIPGTLLYQIQPTTNLLYQAGQFIAQLDVAMTHFHHKVYETHTAIWSLDAIPKLKNFVFAIQDENRKQIVLAIVQEFAERVLKVRDKLEAGMIHGDFNEQNILVEETDGNWRIKAILDFGDSQYSCYLYELAIAVAYMTLLKKDISAGGHVIAGYFSVKQLPAFEFDLIKICVCARLCQSLVLGAYTYLKQPQNVYLLTTAKAGWEVLIQLWEEPEEKTKAIWKSIIEK